MLIAQNDRISIRKTTPEDIAYVIRQERDPSNAPFVGQWSKEQHYAALGDPDCRHWIVEVQPGGRPVGFMILRGLINPYGNVELMRLVITEKSQGYGRAALQLVKQIVFEQMRAHRFWLDVRSQNTRARHLYESEGLVVEGTLRECLKIGETYESLVVLSMLEHEWRN